MTPEDEEFNRIEREAAMQIPPPDNIAKYVDALVKGTHEISSLTIRPKRTWVSLTDEELSKFDVDPIEAKLMIAKLQEKNT